MAGLSVRLYLTPYADYMTVAGTQLALDFSSDVGEGERVLAYMVGLSFFQVRYATDDSAHESEYIGQMGVSLVPNLVGNTVYVTANLILTDFDGSGASENQDVNGRNTYASVTGIAYIGTSLSDQTAVLCTGYDLPGTGTSSGDLVINSSQGVQNTYFLSGFNVYVSPKGKSAEPSSFSASGKANISGSTATLDGNVAIGNASTDGSVDVGFLSTLGVTNYAVVEPTLDWSGTNGQSGRTASIDETFTIPNGYSTISNAGLLIQSVDLSVGNPHHIQEIYFGLLAGGLTISGNAVSGQVAINMWGDRDGNYYLESGDMTVYLIVQFA